MESLWEFGPHQVGMASYRCNMTQPSVAIGHLSLWSLSHDPYFCEYPLFTDSNFSGQIQLDVNLDSVKHEIFDHTFVS